MPRANDAFVAIFDVLGFRALRQSVGAPKLIAMYRELVISRIEFNKSNRMGEINDCFDLPRQGGFPSDLSHVFFSDTIIIYSDDCDFLSHMLIFLLCEDLYS